MSEPVILSVCGDPRLRITSYNVCYTKLLRLGRHGTAQQRYALAIGQLLLTQQEGHRRRLARLAQTGMGRRQGGDRLPAKAGSYNFV